VLRPGGRLLCLEFSKVVVPGMQQLYDLYSFNVIPQIGRWALGAGGGVPGLAAGTGVGCWGC
jgi:ubiquinone/menaquinone biosynthesis C-methylase UbiE